MSVWLSDPMRFWWWLYKPLFWWVISKIEPDNPMGDLGLSLEAPILYAMPKRSIADLLVLYYHCRRLGLPRPQIALSDLQGPGEAGYHCLAEPGLIHVRKDKAPSAAILGLLTRLGQDPAANVQVVPVTILWGKHPGTEEKSLFKLLFTDDDSAGMLQKFFIVLAQGRSNLVLLGRPIQLRELVDEGAPPDQTARKLRRVLRIHFLRQRTSVLGQKLINPEQVIRRIISERPVQAMIDAESQKTHVPRARIETKARHYASEICANPNYSAIRFAEILLTRLWKRLFNGVEYRGLDRVKALAPEYELVYMPTHRSHLDYLLMNYIIYDNGLPTTHTAAGINLNFWPAGPALIARFFQHRKEVDTEELLQGALELYPFLQDEFFLPTPIEDARAVLRTVLDGMVSLGILQSTNQGEVVARPEVATPELLALNILGNALGLVFERYTIMAAMLANNLHKGTVNLEEFEQACQKIVQRLMILSGVNTPESVDKSLFANHIRFLKRMGVLELEGQGRLHITPRIRELSHRSTMLLSPDMRSSIERMTSLSG